MTLLAVGVALAAVPASACPLHKNGILVLDEYYPGLDPGITQLFDELIRAERELRGVATGEVGVAVTRPPEEVGRWTAPENWPVLAIHAAVLPTGKVLHYSYPYHTTGSAAQVFSPKNGRFQDVQWSSDVFCSGLSFLPDGKLFVSGGNESTDCDNQGRNVLHTFDPFTSRWEFLGEMNAARWYPSNLTLGDGRIMMLSGLDDSCQLNPTMEIYSQSDGVELVSSGQRRIELYPRVHLLSSGEVAHVAPESDTYLFDLAEPRWRRVGSTRSGRDRYEGSSFLVPGRTDTVMLCGGFSSYDRFPTTSCEQIDFSANRPRWRQVSAMNFARAHMLPVLLPDGKVLFVGGGQSGLYNQPVRNAELYDPETDTFTVLPEQEYGRMYHATAVLLPDGRVLSAGQDDENIDGIRSGDWGEIYEPPYLFAGRRPKLKKAPKSVDYGERFGVKVKRAREIDSMALVRISAVTHSVNTEQRYVPLEFEVAGAKRLEVMAPDHGNLAPPGYYMLFVLDADGVPSMAKMVRLDAGA